MWSACRAVFMVIFELCVLKRTQTRHCGVTSAPLGSAKPGTWTSSAERDRRTRLQNVSQLLSKRRQPARSGTRCSSEWSRWAPVLDGTAPRVPKVTGTNRICAGLKHVL